MVLIQLLLSPIGCFRLLGTKHNLISLVMIGFVLLVTFGFEIKVATKGYSRHPALYINSVTCGLGLAYMVYNSIFYRLESNLEAWPWASSPEEAGDVSSGSPNPPDGNTDKASKGVKEKTPKDSAKEGSGKENADIEAPGSNKEDDHAGSDEPRKVTDACPFTGLEATMTCPVCQTKVHRAVWHERDPWLTFRMDQGIITLDVDRHGRVSSVILAREHGLKARKLAKKNRDRPNRMVPVYARAPPPGYKHSRGWLLWWQMAPFKGYVPFSNGMVPEYSRPCPFDGPTWTEEQKQALIQEEREARHAEANFLTAAISEMCVGCYAHNLCWNVGPRLFYTLIILSISLTLLLHALDEKYATTGARVFLDGLSAYYAYCSVLLGFNCVASTHIFQQYYDKLPYKWPLKPWEGTLLWLANFGSSHPEHPPGIPSFLIPEDLLKVPVTPLQRKLRIVQRSLFNIVATYRLPPDWEPPPDIPPPQKLTPSRPPPPPTKPSGSTALPAPLAGLLNVLGLKSEGSKPKERKAEDSEPKDSKPEDSEPDEESKPEDSKPKGSKPEDRKLEIVVPTVDLINPDVLSPIRKAAMASVIGMPLQAPRRSSFQEREEARRGSSSNDILTQAPRRSSFQGRESARRGSSSSDILTQAPRRSSFQEREEARRASSSSDIQTQAPRRSSFQEREVARRGSSSSDIQTMSPDQGSSILAPLEERRPSAISSDASSSSRSSSSSPSPTHLTGDKEQD